MKGDLGESDASGADRAKRKGLGWKICVAAGGRVHDLGQKASVEVHMRIKSRGETMEGPGSSNLWVSCTPRKEGLKGENQGLGQPFSGFGLQDGLCRLRQLRKALRPPTEDILGTDL